MVFDDVRAGIWPGITGTHVFANTAVLRVLFGIILASRLVLIARWRLWGRSRPGQKEQKLGSLLRRNLLVWIQSSLEKYEKKFFVRWQKFPVKRALNCRLNYDKKLVCNKMVLLQQECLLMKIQILSQQNFGHNKIK